MPQFNIHWKGIPHHHLPRIRVSSLDFGTGPSRRLAHIAAFEVFRLPYSLSFRRARLQQRSRIRRRKRETGKFPEDRSSLIRTVYPTMSNTWLSGLASPRFDLLSQGEREGKLGNLSALRVVSTSFRNIHSDAVSSIHFGGKKGVELAVADSLRCPVSKSPSDKFVDIDIQREKYTHGGRIKQGGTSHDQLNLHYNNCKSNMAISHDRPPIHGSSRTYDQKIPIRKERNHTISMVSRYDIVNKVPSTHLVQARITDKQPICLDLSRPQAIDVSTSRVSRDSMAKPPGSVSLSPRNPTGRISLRNFKRGLERHLIAQEAIRQACLSHSSSLSSSILSANTVVELVPYMAEFKAAGLAVTSHEQRGALVLHHKDVRAKIQNQANRKLGLEIIEPIESHDGSGGELYSIIKPTDVTVAGIQRRGGQGTALADSDQTKISKKLRLPWLRKAPTSSSLAKQVPANRGESSSYVRPSSASTCETRATTIIDFTPQPVEVDVEQTNPDNQFISIPLPDTKDSDINYVSLMTAVNEVACPVMLEKPSCTVSGGDALPQDLFVDSNHYTIAASPDIKSNGNGKPRDESGPQSSTMASLNSPSTILSHCFSPFRASAKLCAAQKIPFAHDLRPANSTQHIESAITEQSPSEPPRPTRSPPPVPPKDHVLPFTATSQLPDISIPNEYSFETPSIFEQALHGVANKSKLLQDQHAEEEIQARRLPFDKSVGQGHVDPVKRKSASYQPRRPYSDKLNTAETSPLAFARTSETRATISKDHSDIRDKDVAKGLQVALAAAYDKELDLQVMEISGHRVRKFLFDLKAFEGLGVNGLRDQATRTARLRREEQYQKVVGGHGCNHTRLYENPPVEQVLKNKKNERRRPVVNDDLSARQGLLIAEMLRKRSVKAGETVLERAIAMGWRNRSVSVGN